MGTFEVHLRVLDKANKAKFSHFQLSDCPKFTFPEMFKLYLLENHPNVIAPAKTTNFKCGYFMEGRGNRKFDIIDDVTLQKAYEDTSNLKRICLWVDPHTPHIQILKPKAKKNTNQTKGNIFTHYIELYVVV